MPDRDIETIMQLLRDMRSEQRADVSALHAKIDSLTANGCSRLPEHARVMADHETRIRSGEEYRYRQTGQIAMVGAGGGILAAATAALGRFLLRDVFGG